ncbi:hypothetical protein [Streptacidiphilus sp. MAP5-3]
MQMLGQTGTVEDVLINLTSQYHLPRRLMSRSGAGFFSSWG